MSKLTEVRCPFPKITKSGKRIVCNRLIVKVLPESKGEAYCTSCSLPFDFEVDRQNRYHKSVEVKREDK